MNTTTRLKPFVTCLAVNLAATAAYGSAHLMQIEQVIGGVDGNTSAQAIQLRMRANNQHLTVFGNRIIAYDAAGQNPIVIAVFPADQPLANGLLGDRILIATANFSNFTQPAVAVDFVMLNSIPESYFAAGSLTWEFTNSGTVLWRLSWGGSSYTGPTGGDHSAFTDNDLDDEFGPPFPGSLPADGLRTLLFQGAASDLSTNNADDYALSEGPAVITNNSRDSGTVTAPAPFGACCETSTGCTEGVAEAECQGPPFFRYGGDGSVCAMLSPPCFAPVSITLEVVAEGLSSPIVATHAGDGSGRFFIADQTGQIRILDADGALLAQPFLDISGRMVELDDFFDERGLLGLTFHPDYADNGRFFVRYSAPRAGTPEEPCNDPKAFVPGCHIAVLSEFAVSADPNLADPDSERILFTIDEPEFNHNAGTVAFGPDGFLYFSLGDGGGRDDGLSNGEPPGSQPLHGPIGNGQDIETPLGAVLRLDVDSASDPGLEYAIPPDNPFVGSTGLDEIYAYGFRNPFKFSFDDGVGGDGALYLGDVGQELFEEVNIVEKGGNYGWVIREGAHCFDPLNPEVPPTTCAGAGSVLGDPLIDPVSEYLQPIECAADTDCAAIGVGCGTNGLCLNEGGISVIAGFVYRGSAFARLIGTFIYGDFSADFLEPVGRLYHFDTSGPNAFVRREFSIFPNRVPFARFLKGFGEDEQGEVYVCASDMLAPAGDTGVVLRIVQPLSPPSATAVSPRYLAITPPAGAFPVGLVVTPACDDGISTHVAAPSGPDNVALLATNPSDAAFLTPAEWGTTVYVTGADIVPTTDYLVQTDGGVPGAPALSAAVTTTTLLWGDVVGLFDPDAGSWTPPDGSVDIPTDIVSLIEAFGSRPGAPEVFRADLVGFDNGIGCVPDQRIDIVFDITTAIDAFRGLSYETSTGCPGPCP